MKEAFKPTLAVISLLFLMTTFLLSEDGLQAAKQTEEKRCETSVVSDSSRSFLPVEEHVLSNIVAQASNLQYPDFVLPVDERVLSNGIRVLMLERRHAPTISACLAVDVGSSRECAGKTGVSHLLEHMMFKGTALVGTSDYEKEKPILDRIDTWVDRLDDELAKGRAADAAALDRCRKELEYLSGEYARTAVPNEFRMLYSKNGIANLNASTSRDSTYYYCSMPANVLDLWLRIESERFLAPVFREFYTEREVVREERRLVAETSPSGVLRENLFMTAYTRHGYRWPIIGVMDDLMRIRKSDVARHFETYYVPARMVIAVVGNFRTEEMFAQLERWFGRIPARPCPAGDPPEEPDGSALRHTTVKFPAQPQLLIGFHATALGDEDGYVLNIVAEILAGGDSSRLHSNLVIENKMCSFVGADAPRSKYPGLFVLSAAPVKPHTCGEVEKEILAALARMAREPVTDAELEKAKNRLEVAFLKRIESNLGLAQTLAVCEISATSSGWEYLRDAPAKHRQVLPEDIIRVCSKYFRPERMTMATLEPE
jgi:predicted Zn-dependent peptidase